MVLPADLDVGDVVLDTTLDRYNQHVTRKYRILRIGENGDKQSPWRLIGRIAWLDTGEETTWRWRTARGVSPMVYVVGGPKLEAAKADRSLIFMNVARQWVWRNLAPVPAR